MAGVAAALAQPFGFDSFCLHFGAFFLEAQIRFQAFRRKRSFFDGRSNSTTYFVFVRAIAELT